MLFDLGDGCEPGLFDGFSDLFVCDVVAVADGFGLYGGHGGCPLIVGYKGILGMVFAVGLNRVCVVYLT